MASIPAGSAAENRFGVQVTPVVLDITKTYHGVSIQVGGAPIGRIQSWNPTFASRVTTLMYELNYQTWGRPVDITPGIESGRSITCTRVETWLHEFETILGASTDQDFRPQGLAGTNPVVEWRDLCEQTQPFEVNEVWLRGNIPYRTWTYRGCWFTEKSIDDMSAEGEPAVKANVTMQYVIRHSIQ